MNYSIFYVSKPLQYFNATNIEDSNEKICIIVNHFKDAFLFYEKVLKNSNHWKKVIIVNTPKEAFLWMNKRKHQIINIYIDSDFGLIKNIWLFPLRKINIYVYEEGIGTYRTELRKNSLYESVKIFLLQLCGIDNYMGGGIYTKGVIVYDTKRYKSSFSGYKKQILTFRATFLNHINTTTETEVYVNQDEIAQLNNLYNQNVFIYLTSWSYNNLVDDILKKFAKDLKILKPHPHIKDNLLDYVDKFDVVINGGMMIEFLLIKIAINANKLTIVHENSSAVQYLDKNLSIDIIDISKKLN